MEASDPDPSSGEKPESRIGTIGVGKIQRLEVIAEEEGFLVVEKPAGILIHPTRPGEERTFWHALRELLAYEVANGHSIGIITRLDRETSGLVLVAKSSEASRHLGDLMFHHKIRKTYLAICYGWPVEDRFVAEEPIVRLGEVQPVNVWLRRGVHPSGAVAKTEFEVLQRTHLKNSETPVSLVRARPLTGRTHQIRVHLAHAGFPIVGDKLYAGGEQSYLEFIRDGWTSKLAEKLHHSRHALHASGLEWKDGAQKHDCFSPLPKDLVELLTEEPSRALLFAD